MKARCLAAAVVACAVLAAPAAAAPPVREHVDVRNVVRDNGEHCGFPVVWNIHLTADVTHFLDDEGVRVKTIAHVTEDNTVTNLATGKTLRDAPVNFVRTHHYENGVRVYTVDRGVMLNVRDGNERVLDIGWVKYRILPDGRWDVLDSAGHHPAYEALDERPFADVLSVFCGVLD